MMKLADPFVQELDNEVKATRKCLERVPEDKFAWKPHEKSMTLGRLASHVAESLGWGVSTLESEEFAFTSGQFQAFTATNRDELLKTFDDNVAKLKRELGEASNEHLMHNWVMKMDGQTIIDMPRAAVIRSWVLNHLIHHRGQLSVYLRLIDVPVPSIYGPSADEQG